LDAAVSGKTALRAPAAIAEAAVSAHTGGFAGDLVICTA